jgi:FKBP-type peptidyl-prolyl cis-trans isomerase SlyD
MTVKKDKVVEMHYTLKNDVGDVLDSSKGQEKSTYINKL